MKINKVTITGADDKISQLDLQNLSEKFPFVEWAILFSKNKEGQQRYPTQNWISLLNNELELSAHFCGWWSKEVIVDKNFELIESLDKKFKRVQLNFNFKNAKTDSIDELIQYASTTDRNIILQYNASNASLLDKYKDLPSNVHFLYDSSGGRGTEIKEIQNPIENSYTGYSGGLSPDNIEQICQMINDVRIDKNVFIDLETGARTDNEFDLEKVKDILEKSSKYINL